jgi:hypothetical protein
MIVITTLSIPKKYMIKFINNKRHFQLLEVMIAVFLIMICVVPTLEVFTNMYKHEAEANLINQRDHFVRLIHANLIEKMYKNEIPIEDIVQGPQTDFSDHDLNEKMKKIGYSSTYEIKEVWRDPIKEPAKRHLCHLTIHMHKKNEKSKDFLYMVYVDRGGRAGGNSSGEDSEDASQSGSDEIPDPEFHISGDPNKKYGDPEDDGSSDYSSSSNDEDYSSSSEEDFSSSSEDRESYSSDDESFSDSYDD